ncbi:MAG: CatB-related O-acetyltransferase [Pseudomonadota bacterium]
MHLISLIKAYLHKQKANKAQIKRFGKPERSAKLFSKQYPNHVMGANCYGVPKIKHAHPDARLTIGNYCSIANNVEIYLGGNHRTDWISTYPFPHFFPEASHIRDYEVSKGNVDIGSDVWLCQNATILSGVSIGHGAIIANGAIVSKDVAPYEIVGGNPAKHIRWRFDKETRDILLASAWWNWPQQELLQIVDILCSDNISQFIRYIQEREKV